MSVEALLVRIRGRLRTRVAVCLSSSPGVQTDDAIEKRSPPKVEQEPDLEIRWQVPGAAGGLVIGRRAMMLPPQRSDPSNPCRYPFNPCPKERVSPPRALGV